MNNLFVTKIKADNTQKADIIMEFLDVNTGFRPLAGFSIKSQMGSASTLMNASSATNFIYKINGIDDSIMNAVNVINSKTKIIDRMSFLQNSGAIFSFCGVSNPVFADNL